MKLSQKTFLTITFVVALGAASLAQDAAQTLPPVEPSQPPAARSRPLAAPAQIAPAAPGIPSMSGGAPLTPDDYNPFATPGAMPPGHRGSSALIVRFSEQEPKAQMELEEDLNIMARLLERNLQRSMGGPSHEVRMGVPILLDASAGRVVQGLYLEGFGALFTLTVNFPLIAPSGEEAKQQEEPGKVDDWEAARRDLYESRSSRESAESALSERYLKVLPRLDKSHESAQYNAARVEKLREELLAALRNAGNIRHLGPEEFVAITVFGSSFPGKLIGVDRRTNLAILNMLDENNKTYVVSVPLSQAQGITARSALSVRVKKSDVDAFASGNLTEVEWKRKVETQTYHTHGGAAGASAYLERFDKDSSFLHYFGEKGVAEVERAFEILRNPKD